MENRIVLGGIVTLLIALSSGVTWYIQDAGTKTSCKTGWIYVETGNYEGYYKCSTSTGDRFESCYSITDSSNTKNYWCQRGNIIKQEETYKPWEEGVIYCPKSPGTCHQ